MKKYTKTKEIKKIIYVAVDGTEFESEQECADYETNCLSKYITLFGDDGTIFNFSCISCLGRVYGIVFHKTDEEFIDDVLYSFGCDDSTINKISDEELHYKNKEGEIVLIYSNTYECWVNPAYRINTFREEATYITELAKTAIE